MDQSEIANILREISELLQFKNENPFKIRAYENGARIIETLEDDLHTLVAEDRLNTVKGIGETLEEQIKEMVLDHQSTYYEELKSSIPPGLLEMTKIPGLGAKKIMKIYNELDITTLGELEYAALENRLLDLEGFGKKSQQNILEGIKMMKRYHGHFLLSHALEAGKDILQWVEKHPKTIQCSLGGSIRRRKEIIKDIDILASCAREDREEIMNHFLSYPQKAHTNEQGDTKSSMGLNIGINVDIRLVEKKEYPYALHHFTGSKEHNTAMRHRAKKMGLKINEYGIFKEETILPAKDEKEFFSILDLDYIPPELRENRGEIEAAEKGQLPKLITREDIKGTLHNHSHYSDGNNSIEEMVQEAIKMNFSYIGISDHSQSAAYARGLTKDIIHRKHQEIHKLNEKYPSITIFKGTESDILSDGSLDYDNDTLHLFDYVIASVHSQFQMSKEDMTKRIITAIKNPHTRILGHVTGRLLLSREGYEVDIEEILKACAHHHVAIEINSNPHRLDLDWRHCKRAKELGVKLAIEGDAHRLSGLHYIDYGISIARKGWLEARDIINHYDAESMAKFFRERD